MTTRIETAAEALEERAENDDWEWCLGDASAALAAADAHDAANGIHRIALDDATVERAAKALHDTGAYAKHWDERGEGVKEFYREDARAVLAAAVEGSGE